MPPIDTDLAAAEPASGFVGLVDQLATAPGTDPELVKRLAAVRDFLVKPDKTKRPFLSVLLRTQGKRIELLKDALLCLAGQTDEDFEVFVLSHNASAEDGLQVRAVLDRLAEPLSKRVTLIEVTGGTRAKPLNAGLDAARGQYISVFDDDDLVFGHYVEEFHKAAEGANGKMLRALVANQSLTPETWPGGAPGFRTLSWPKREFPEHFDQVEHLLVNVSPFMTWAFPRQLFTTFGLRFDEELAVCEDWDVILRGSLLCGVREIEVLTSIYRRWSGGDSSYNVHSSAAWRQSEERVTDRVNDSVILLPPGSLRELRHLALMASTWDTYHFLFNGNRLRQPLQGVWDAVYPAARFARRVRNRIRRSRRG